MTRHYLYKINYPGYEEDLCKIEMRALFKKNIDEKNFFSTIPLKPSISPFIRSRIEILKSADGLEGIVDWITETNFESEDFLVNYMTLGDTVSSTKKKSICREIGYVIGGDVSFKQPKNIFGITCYQDKWYFGLYTENKMDWLNHNNKPFSYSSALSIRLAKVLVNLAGNGDFNKKLIDPCCGVGTALIEGLYSGYDIVGYDIIEKVAEHANVNLAHFGYSRDVKCSNIKAVEGRYDASIVDIPYGILSATDKANQLMIIKEAKRLSKKVIVVSKEALDSELEALGLNVLDKCSVSKAELHHFIRNVWVCE